MLLLVFCYYVILELLIVSMIMFRESKMTQAELSYIAEGLGDFSGHSAKFKS